jgi:cobalt/nickel transport system permease protein
MHMADALISPVVGGTLWAVSAAVTYSCAKKAGTDFPEQKIPLMGVLGAFVFAAQMINFAIPGTGSSGHLGGGMLLSVLLGPQAGFLVMASVLTIQALLFADGGLLALGCNIFNLAFFPCFLAYPLVYRTVAGTDPSKIRLAVGLTLGTVFGLQLGALGVVAETIASGITELPFQTFALFMLPIHLVIGLVEGAVTTVVLWYVRQEAPGLFSAHSKGNIISAPSFRRIVLILLTGAALTAGILSWFASPNPDGLEWSVLKTSGKENVDNSSAVHTLAASWQGKIALFADYQVAIFGSADKQDVKREEPRSWPAVSENTSTAGLLGSVLTLVVAGVVGAGCHVLAKRNAP